MLVLTRKSGESIVIGQECKIKILSVDKGTVRLGINAPREIAVYRMELFEAIRNENIRAARSLPALSKQLGELLSKQNN